jgi:DNA-binding transcriptional ArsR family regulator
MATDLQEPEGPATPQTEVDSMANVNANVDPIATTDKPKPGKPGKPGKPKPGKPKPGKSAEPKPGKTKSGKAIGRPLGSKNKVQSAPDPAPPPRTVRPAKSVKTGRETVRTRPYAANGKVTSKANPGPGGKASRTDSVIANSEALKDCCINLHMASHPTRLGLMLAMDYGRENVGELSAQFGMSQPAVSHHLALLRHARLVEPSRQGKQNFYALTEKGKILVNGIMPLIRDV